MSVFAVQTIPEGSPESHFVIISAESPEQALAAAAEQSIKDGAPNTAMVATFSIEELQTLVDTMREAQAA